MLHHKIRGGVSAVHHLFCYLLFIFRRKLIQSVDPQARPMLVYVAMYKKEKRISVLVIKLNTCQNNRFPKHVNI